MTFHDYILIALTVIIMMVAHSVFRFEQLLRVGSERNLKALSNELGNVLLETLKRMDSVKEADEQREPSDDDERVAFEVLPIPRVEMSDGGTSELRLFVERPMSLDKLVFRGTDDTLQSVTLESLRINDVEMLTYPARLSTWTEVSASGEYAFPSLGMVSESGDDIVMRFDNHGPQCEFQGFMTGRGSATHGDDALETSFLRPPMNGSSPHAVEEQDVVMTLAFAIEDPCGADAIQFARELLRFARSVPPEARGKVIEGICNWRLSLACFATIPSASSDEVQ